MSDIDLELGKHRALSLGLHLCEVQTYSTNLKCYRAEDVHKLLGIGQQVKGGPILKETHEGLLIGVREIVQETREEKLERWIRQALHSSSVGGLSSGFCAEGIRLLEEKL